MLFNAINRAKTANGRRVLSFLALIGLPFILVLSILFGTVLYIGDLALTLVKDVWNLITVEVRDAASDLVTVIRTGDKLYA